mmetsp:Transcript_18825/g.44089  ORF Transcript_18825/g.44089 Transcript_18825/m.44089 type:complete len:146 (-) Transcript_18825:80-517(-)|eukprot:CAMPEP_0114540772 /NCGR_PEP_ID=MMETSP0114-20121206/952_1 /TAXON_ID=31324 /ORGANISM="Goniomonas sp, Strain m" /LENGTH=145 /DNA_ID=CAMNT_0001724969 /DNA_START=62 /DNA_END=499 /DNA_ORIENTATION=-
MASEMAQRCIVSTFAGVIFGVAWLVFVDGIITNDRSDNPVELKNNAGLVYLPGLLAVIALFMINTVNPEDLSNDQIANKLKLWLFFSIIIGMGAIIVAVWVLVDVYINRNADNSKAAAVGSVVQTVLIMISSLVFWVAKGIRSDS